jgi:hypothetical protein
MNFTYIGSRKAKILSDLKGSASSTGTALDLKGTTQSVDEYDFTVSGRGNPQGTTTKRYFLESSKKNTMGLLPKPKFPSYGGNPFQEIKREDFEYLADETKAPKGFGDPIKDKKWILYVVLAVAGYFAYKKFKK